MRPLTGKKVAATQVEDLDAIKHAVRGLGGDFVNKVDESVSLLIVGKIWSEKYWYWVRRKEISSMISVPKFLEIHASYVEGVDMDVSRALKDAALLPFEGCQLTFSQATPEEVTEWESLIVNNGGRFTSQLTRKCLAVVSNSVVGKKVEFARKWKIPAVRSSWLFESIKRGYALSPESFDLVSEEPKETSTPSPEPPEPAPVKIPESRPKRKPVDVTDLFVPKIAKPDIAKKPLIPKRQQEGSVGIFKGLSFTFSGFDSKEGSILRKIITSHDGKFTTSPDYHIINSKKPVIPSEPIKVITEWAIERSLNKGTCLLDDFWGAPAKFPIEGFSGMKISLSGYSNTELVHLEKLVQMLGADLCQTFNAERHLLIASSDHCKKFKYAKSWGVPVVSEQWIWDCAKEGKKLEFLPEHIIYLKKGTSKGGLRDTQTLSTDDSASFVDYGSEDEADQPSLVGKNYVKPIRRSNRLQG